jgi:hypothetical protein
MTTSIDQKIEKSRSDIMKQVLKLTELYVERDNAEGFIRMAHFLLAGVMSTLHPLMGQRMAFETVLALLDEMGTIPLPQEFQNTGIYNGKP